MVEFVLRLRSYKTEITERICLSVCFLLQSVREAVLGSLVSREEIDVSSVKTAISTVILTSPLSLSSRSSTSPITHPCSLAMLSPPPRWLAVPAPPRQQPDSQMEKERLRKALLCAMYPDEGHELSRLDLYLSCTKRTTEERNGGRMRTLWV